MNMRGLTTTDSDAELIARSLAGEADAFRDLYRKHEKRVRSVMRNLCGDNALDDHVQDVFVRVWKYLNGFRHDSNFSTWLFRIAHNVAMDCRKAHATQRSGILEIASEQAVAAQYHEKPENQELVKKMLESLSFEHRRVLVLVDLEEFSLQEVAAIAAIPLGTVKSRLHHARADARAFLQKQGWKL